MVIPKGSAMAIKGYATIGLLLTEDAFVNFKDYKVNETIQTLLDDKRPILSMNADGDNNILALSITDKDSGLNFKLSEQPIGSAFFKFLEDAHYHDKILLMVGYFGEDNSI